MNMTENLLKTYIYKIIQHTIKKVNTHVITRNKILPAPQRTQVDPFKSTVHVNYLTWWTFVVIVFLLFFMVLTRRSYLN